MRNRNRCRCSCYSYQLIIFLDIIYMNIILSSWFFMISRFNCYFIGSIGLLLRCVPDNIILTTYAGPSWNFYFTNTVRAGNTWNNHIKGSCVWIIISNGHFSLRSTKWKLGSCSTYANQFPIILNVIKVNVIESCRKFVIYCPYCYFISSISLFSSCIPNNVILTIDIRPGRYFHFTNAVRSRNVRHNHIKGSRVRILVLNRDFSLYWLICSTIAWSCLIRKSSSIIHTLVKYMTTR